MNNAFCDVAEHPAMAVYRNVNPQHMMWNMMWIMLWIMGCGSNATIHHVCFCPLSSVLQFAQLTSSITFPCLSVTVMLGFV